jgi:hypothetical protein
MMLNDIFRRKFQAQIMKFKKATDSSFFDPKLQIFGTDGFVCQYISAGITTPPLTLPNGLPLLENVSKFTPNEAKAFFNKSKLSINICFTLSFHSSIVPSKCSCGV